MIQKVGKLEMFSVAEKPELIAEPVAKALSAMADTDSVGVAEIDPNLSDTAASVRSTKSDLIKRPIASSSRPSKGRSAGWPRVSS